MGGTLQGGKKHPIHLYKNLEHPKLKKGFILFFIMGICRILYDGFKCSFKGVHLNGHMGKISFLSGQLSFEISR